jgi:thioredoxin 1
MRLLRFTASWCNPCKQLSENLERAELKMPIEVIDIDAHSEVAVDYGIRSVPTLVMMDGNIEIKRITGVKTVSEIKEWAK